ncbi:MAG TPA: PAS domain S-box protein [Ktedonobacterales bacterium]|jgi:PAS domain S-box-containing protein
MLSDPDAALPMLPPYGRHAFAPGSSVADGAPLTQSEARFRALAQATGQVYWIADAQGEGIDLASWRAFTGQTVEEATGNGWLAALHPEDRESALADWAAAVASGRPYRREHRVRRADGQYRKMLAQAYPALDADGTVREWVGVDIDITRLEELRADVQASQEDFRATFDQAAVGMAHVRPDGRLLRVNQKCCEILGHSREELLNLSFQELTYPADLDANLVSLQQVLAGEISTYTLEKRYIRKDGSLVWASLTCSLKRDLAGAPEYLIAVIKDISQRKAAEAALQQSEQQYRQLFETMAQGVIYYSPDGEVLSANPAALRMLEMTEEEAQGHTTQNARRKVIREDGSLFPGAAIPTMRALHSGQTVSDVVGVFSSKEQAYRWFKVTAIPEFRPNEQKPYRVFATFDDISERRRLEEELRTRVLELEAIFASMNDGLIVHRADGSILRSNPAYAALVGWPTDSPLHALPRAERYQILQIRDGQGQPIPQEQLPLSQNLRGESVTQEQIFRRRDGQDRDVIVRGAPLTDAAGRVMGTVEVIHDVTDQRRLEREAAAHARELEAIFTSMNEGLAVFRSDGTILRANPAYVALSGWPAGSALYTMSPQERLQALYLRDEHGQPIPLDQFSTLRLLRGETLGEEQIFRRRDGRDVYVNLRGAPMTDAAGRVIGAVVVLHDDTERRQLEQQTQDALKALLRMAELLVQHPQQNEEQSLLVGRHLAELACSLLGCPVASIITLDPQTLGMQVLGTVGYMSDQEEQLRTIIAGWVHRPPDLTHLARLAAGETLVLDVTQPPYEDFAAFFEARQAVVAPMQLGGAMIGMVIFNPSRFAQTFTEQQIALAGATAQLVGLVVERERLLHEREDARAHALALDESNRQMDTFLSMVSHELRNPMASMKLGVQLIQRRLRERAFFGISGSEGKHQTVLPSLQELLMPVERQILRLEHLVKDLLDASRIKEGKLDLRLQHVDLNAIVQEVLVEQRKLTPERVIRMLTPADQALFVEIDDDLIKQAIINYLTNALKYSPETAPVLVGVDSSPGQARVWVRDQGPGIPSADQERIWERFQRVPGMREQGDTAGGLGLGLYITRMLIEQHQGQVGVTNEPGQGATFWFTLPLSLAGAP